jgi:hypothetical protein
MWQVWGRREMRTRFWWLELTERDHLEILVVDVRYKKEYERKSLDWIHLA